MCNTCNGLGRVASSPAPGMIIVEKCSCSHDMSGLDRIEQQLAELDARIEQFERENGI